MCYVPPPPYIWICRHIFQHSKNVGYLSPLVECADISMCWHICQHLDVSYGSVYVYMSASGHVNILASTRTNMLTYMSAYLSPLASRMCRHLYVFGIYFNILMCRHICRHLDMSTYFGQHKNKCVDMYVGIFATTRGINRHLNVWACVSASWYTDIYVNTFFRVLANMSA